MKLGVSVYPEKESVEELEAYLSLAGKYGYEKVFASMFSVPGSKEEVFAYFEKLCTLAHQNHLCVCIDANAEMFKRFELSEKDLSPLKNIGIDEIRMDFPYNDERDQVLINNPEGIKIVQNSFLVKMVTALVEKIQEPMKVSVCHNFYPERYSGMGRKEFIRLNEYWKEKGIASTAFISSENKEAHGPWPAFDGLPTCEEHRGRSVDFQVRELLAMGNIDCAIFGNAFASEAELKAAREAVEAAKKIEPRGVMEEMFAVIVENLGEKKITFAVSEEKGMSEQEKSILYDFHKHCDVNVGCEYMHRSCATRISISGGKETIAPRPVAKKYFEKGDLMIVNETSPRYHGELQICLQPMENDGQRNLVGHLDEDELHLLDYLKPEYYFDFKPKQ